MMRITEIRKLKSGRYGIFADGEYVDSLDDETLVLSRLKTGREIDESELAEILLEAKKRRAKDKAMNLLSFRDHSKAELVKKLSPKLGEEAAEEAAEKMEEIGLVNDADYALKFAKELIFTKLLGRDRVLYELSQRGIDRELAFSALESIEFDPIENARRLLLKKYPRGIQDESARRKAAALLTRSGYRFSEIKSALNIYDTDYNE